MLEHRIKRNRDEAVHDIMPKAKSPIFRLLHSCFGGEEATSKHSILYQRASTEASTPRSSLHSEQEDSADHMSEHCEAYPSSSEVPRLIDTVANSIASDYHNSEDGDEELETLKAKRYPFLLFRLSYLFVTLVIMLADGLQGM
jgi:hypothetical protein